jgi:hypothetical protein
MRTFLAGIHRVKVWPSRGGAWPVVGRNAGLDAAKSELARRVPRCAAGGIWTMPTCATRSPTPGRGGRQASTLPRPASGSEPTTIDGQPSILLTMRLSGGERSIPGYIATWPVALTWPGRPPATLSSQHIPCHLPSRTLSGLLLTDGVWVDAPSGPPGGSCGRHRTRRAGSHRWTPGGVRRRPLRVPATQGSACPWPVLPARVDAGGTAQVDRADDGSARR